jgi:uridine kinase
VNLARVDFATALAAATAPGIRLIGIDGLPVSGKSTLADAIIERNGGAAIYLDDFVLPQPQWHGRVAPAFPFPYIRYADFLNAANDLVHTGRTTYAPYDWSTGGAGPLRTVTVDRPVIVEGVSALHPDLAPLYDLRIWVDSDPATTLAASLARGVGDWEAEWRNLFLPSVDLYLATNPRQRADLIVAGRGIGL